MALTQTEENQLRELLRSISNQNTGVTAGSLPVVNGHSINSYLTRVGDDVYQAYSADVARHLVATSIGNSGANITTANGSYNHLMTRDATRSEITRVTDSRITAAQNAANAAQNTANTANNNATNAQSRVGALESWRSGTVDPALNSRLRVGNVYSNPVAFFGAMNSAGGDIVNRTHRFSSPLAKDPVVFFSLQGDVNYPRYEFLYENGRVTGFILFHSPPPGRWMAIGTPA